MMILGRILCNPTWSRKILQDPRKSYRILIGFREDGFEEVHLFCERLKEKKGSCLKCHYIGGLQYTFLGGCCSEVFTVSCQMASNFNVICYEEPPSKPSYIGLFLELLVSQFFGGRDGSDTWPITTTGLNPRRNERSIHDALREFQSARPWHFPKPLFLARKMVYFCLNFSHSSRSRSAGLLFCICCWLFKVPIDFPTMVSLKPILGDPWADSGARESRKGWKKKWAKKRQRQNEKPLGIARSGSWLGAESFCIFLPNQQAANFRVGFVCSDTE